MAALATAACRVERAASGPVLLDDFGDTVHLGRHPSRIVSLGPANTEILFAIGAGPRVVGRSRWDRWPDSTSRVADVGDALRPNVEAVLALRPDLVVLYASGDDRGAARAFRAAGIETASLKGNTLDDFRREVRLLGAAAGDTARARAVVDSVDRTLARVRAATAGLDRPTVYWHIWDAPPITIGRGSYLDELVTIAGGRNVYGDLGAPSPQVSLEDIARRAPSLVLASPEGAKKLAASATWRSVPAVRDGRVMVVDNDVVGRPSVRLGEAAVLLARLLHPGAL